MVEAYSITPFIANDSYLNSEQRLAIITGPNMGGKSTYMRQTALICLLARAGSFVPAETARIGQIDRIFTRIGASDDLSGGKSTFMVEMTETATILNYAGKNSLVLMDEVGRGTSTYDGLSIAMAAAKYLALHSQAMTLFATHYFEMTDLANDYSAIINLHLDALQSGDEVTFLHNVKSGAASQSYGLYVANIAGIAKPVIKDAGKHYWLKISLLNKWNYLHHYHKNTKLLSNWKICRLKISPPCRRYSYYGNLNSSCSLQNNYSSANN